MNKVLIFTLAMSFLSMTLTVEATSCTVVPINVWGGTPSHLVEDLTKPVQLVVVTHTVTSKCDTNSACKRVARAIREGALGRGSTDIGLSFLIGGNGKIYEGAGWKVGNHTKGYNEKSISLSFIGDFSDQLPTKKALEAAASFLGCSLNNHHLSYEYNLVGHRQLKATISPGNALQREIEDWPHWTSDVSSL